MQRTTPKPKGPTPPLTPLSSRVQILTSRGKQACPARPLLWLLHVGARPPARRATLAMHEMNQKHVCCLICQRGRDVARARLRVTDSHTQRQLEALPRIFRAADRQSSHCCSLPGSSHVQWHSRRLLFVAAAAHSRRLLLVCVTCCR